MTETESASLDALLKWQGLSEPEAVAHVTSAVSRAIAAERVDFLDLHAIYERLPSVRVAMTESRGATITEILRLARDGGITGTEVSRALLVAGIAAMRGASP